MNKKTNLRLMAGYFSPYKAHLAFVFIALCITSSSVLSLGKGIEFLIDQGFSRNNSALFDRALIIILVAISLLATATFFRSYLINSIAEKVISAIRRDIYRHIIYIAPSYFEASKTSDAISRLTTDSSLLSGIIGSVASVSLRNLLMLIGGVILLLITSPKLTLYTAVIVPLVLILIITLGKKVRIFSTLAQNSVANISAHVEESLNGIKVVQSNTRQQYEIDSFNDKTAEALNNALSWIFLRSILAGLAILLVFMSVTLVLWIGGNDVIAGKMSSGELTSFIFYSILVASSIGGLSEVVGDIQRARGAADRLFELLNITSDIIEPVSPKKISFNDNVISLKEVNFSYPARPNASAISNFSLDIKQGDTIALVGPSGSGKTTIFQLLLRFYDPTSGTIQIGDVNIKDTALNDLRGSFALVPQEAVIFSTSAYDNIRYGRIDASVDEVREAAKSAEILDFLEQLPQGLDTFLGEKGVRISGGERQRIAIARAILRNPKILLLDEATSSLDTQNEKLVQIALEKLMQGRTTLVIAHRLSTIINADKIVVIKDGKIEAIGNHKELITQNGLYAHLAALQG
jgi:ATP-binding cassette subfamily B protein